MYRLNQSPSSGRSNAEFLRRLSEQRGCGCSAPMSRAEEHREPIGCPSMPSLAMVYSPVQAWDGLLDPARALAEGTLFADLVKPFTAARDRC